PAPGEPLRAAVRGGRLRPEVVPAPHHPSGARAGPRVRHRTGGAGPAPPGPPGRPRAGGVLPRGADPADAALGRVEAGPPAVRTRPPTRRGGARDGTRVGPLCAAGGRRGAASRDDPARGRASRGPPTLRPGSTP